MRRVLIICSVHHETGNATAAELHWLLGRLRPEAIFLEQSSTDFSAFMDGSCGTLESAAVMSYRNRNAVELVPVGLPLQAAELKPKFDEMFARIEDANPRYCQLELANRQHTAMGGFAYLNSPYSALLQSEMRMEMRATVDTVGEAKLAELYALWTHTNDLREAAMISGVEAFAGHSSFKKGVLVVGAAHHQPILEKLWLSSSHDSAAIDWDCDWQLEEAALDDDAPSNGDTANRGALG